VRHRPDTRGNQSRDKFGLAEAGFERKTLDECRGIRGKSNRLTGLFFTFHTQQQYHTQHKESIETY